MAHEKHVAVAKPSFDVHTKITSFNFGIEKKGNSHIGWICHSLLGLQVNVPKWPGETSISVHFSAFALRRLVTPCQGKVDQSSAPGLVTT
jgi:hypothetical protein